MELRHLRYFAAAATEMNITRAAARLGIAQPPLTQQIKALEAELGLRLFERVGRGIALTAAGTVFLEEARAILRRTEDAVSRARRAARGEIGRLAAGFTGSASFSPVVTDLLKAYRAAWPDVELTLDERRSALLVGALRTGALDAVFIRPPVSLDGSLEVHALASEAMVVAVPVSHPMARRRSVRLSALRDAAFVSYPRREGAGLSDRVIAACIREGFAPRIAQQAPEIVSAINLVAASMGIAVVPECMAHLRPRDVRYLRLEGSDLRAELGLARRRGDRSETVLNLFRMAGAVE